MSARLRAISFSFTALAAGCAGVWGFDDLEKATSPSAIPSHDGGQQNEGPHDGSDEAAASDSGREPPHSVYIPTDASSLDDRPSAVIDESGNTLFVAAANYGAGSAMLVRCNTATNQCTSMALTTPPARQPSALIDATVAKVLVVLSGELGPYLVRCNLDGTGCEGTDLFVADHRIGGLANYPSANLDQASGHLLVATEKGGSDHNPALYRCVRDGTQCTFTELYTGGSSYTGSLPDSTIDSANAKLLVVGRDNTNGDGPGLHRCSLDGTGCVHTGLAGSGSMSGVWPSVVVDPDHQKLLVATNDAYPFDGGLASVLALFRCELDGSGCVYSNLSFSVGAGWESGRTPSALIANGELLIVTTDHSRDNHPSLFRCAIDGTACSYIDLAAGTGEGSNCGMTPSAVYDSVTRTLFVAVRNDARAGQLGIFAYGPLL